MPAVLVHKGRAHGAQASAVDDDRDAPERGPVIRLLLCEGVPDHEYVYVLVLQDQFSRFVRLVPCKTADSIATVGALLNWFSDFGVCTMWQTDGATHFVNEIVAALALAYGIEHRVVVSYSPWSNGQVERVNREIKTITACLLHEATLSADDWPYVLPIVASALNQTPSRAIYQYAPIEVFTGLPRPSQLQSAFIPRLRGMQKLHDHEGQLADHVEHLRAVLYDRHLTIATHKPRKQRRLAGERDPDFGIGDYVLMARTTASDKTAVAWEGPARILDDDDGIVFSVENLATGDVRRMHARHLKLYADSELHVTQQLIDYAAHSGSGSVVESILDFRVLDGAPELLVKWEFQPVTDASWMPLEHMYDGTPVLVRRFIRLLQDPEARSLLQSFLTKR